MPALLPDVPTTEAMVVELTNKVRAREHLGAVKADPALAAAARAFAAYLARTNTFSHTADGRQPVQRAQSAGYQPCQIAENLALSESIEGFDAPTLARETIDGWLNSPGHRANLLARHVTQIGVAVARVDAVKSPKYVVVQMFGRPAALATHVQISNATKDQLTYTVSGKFHTAEPGMSIRHTLCTGNEPLEFRSSGKRLLSEKFTAQDGKVYTLKLTQGAPKVEVTTRDSVR